ncbi:MAG: hypothetical protein M3092_03455 [Actinomycetia bacterium]|nr:hypothetical protein [Actinomycetes bacterium]
MDDSLKVRLPWVGRGTIFLIIVAALFLGGCGGDDAALTTTTTVPSATTVPEPTTTAVAPTTTVVGGIIAITVPTTTTTTTTTTAATTEAPPATVPATIAPAAAPATVEFTNHGIYAGETWIYFGWDDEDTIAAVTAVLGAPTIDLGWDADSICPSPSRTVKWDDLLLLFTKADTDFWIGGVPHFFTYQYSGSTPELFTTEGIGLGSTLSDLDDAYGGPDLIITESPFVLGEGFWTYKDAPWTGMWGFATGQSPADTVTSINGGAGCGE